MAKVVPQAPAPTTNAFFPLAVKLLRKSSDIIVELIGYNLISSVNPMKWPKKRHSHGNFITKSRKTSMEFYNIKYQKSKTP
jgi:hypothetical protein